ncbi:DNA-binding transcriptional regulator, LysR family [Marinobacter sp. DSM 26671]|jgi:DNA-binding transcriptional LysR family regulator|uniref:LysR family transcriptional regulator n=4 Tax=Marinobacter TaxID=2742 RepID=A0A352IYD3_9GAMM|nr:MULTISPECIES: LysR family transcriptional regulator [Marinobacter]MCR9187205.1 LysR family transcriptional regulator [Alteromonadaceae bacterium]MCW8868937.1 LysR family transcriptional regulator [Marinobacter sp.]ADP98399.1 transcriptional regulator, LysR-family protein [Marinobacter adhaerens HP15]AKV95300.1 LysR family transcriptional regulator [Marinobacter sp. CP1]MBW3226247.1 LysR family transcriptional regulator [Marinobacter adhaerens]|tara:strand:+ start:177 stop:1076 length:900 start_codon:yes stop_codon:yes gene_type:complete
MDWDYLRYIRALAIGGTLAKAGELLGVHQTTVLRRLDQMEESMGVQFFERSRDGLQLTPVGETAFREADRLAIEMENLERKLVGQDSAPVGKVRLAAEDAMMSALLSPILAELVREFPDIELETLTDNDVANLSHREADLTLRPENKPQATLEGERIASIESAVYGSARYCRRHRDMDVENRPEGCLWIIPDETFSHLATGRWYRKQLKNVTSFIRCNSLQSMHALAKAGAGLAVLPCYLGESTRELRRLSDPLEGESVDLWLHVNQDTQQMARVRIVMEYLVERLQSLESQMEISSAF